MARTVRTMRVTVLAVSAMATLTVLFGAVPSIALASPSFATASSSAAVAARTSGSAHRPWAVSSVVSLSSHSVTVRRLNAASQSSNWAGYDAAGGSFKSVTASWTQPTVPSSQGTTDAAFWVGLDGDGSKSVEQIGTEGYTDHGVVYYDAWYEMYPAVSMTISSVTIRPGDAVTASVTADGAGNFTLSLVDTTNGQSYTTVQPSGPTNPYSAEVIAEAPSDTSGNQIALAEFGRVQFSACAFNGQAISAFSYNQIDMVSESGVAEATTSALDATGAVFTVSAGTSITAPAMNSAPTISGSPYIGKTLTCSAGSWSGDPAPSLSYQWLRDGTPISGAAAATYVVRSADAGRALSCRVTASNTAGQAVATSGVVRVAAKPSVSLRVTPRSVRVGGAVTLRGAVTNAVTSRRSVVIYRRVNGMLKRVATVTLTSSGGYQRTLKLTKAGSWTLVAAYSANGGSSLSGAVTVKARS